MSLLEIQTLKPTPNSLNQNLHLKECTIGPYFFFFFDSTILTLLYCMVLQFPPSNENVYKSIFLAQFEYAFFSPLELAA